MTDLLKWPFTGGTSWGWGLVREEISIYILLNFWNFVFGGFLKYAKGECSYFKKNGSSFMLYLIGGVNIHTALISVIVAPKLPW